MGRATWSKPRTRPAVCAAAALVAATAVTKSLRRMEGIILLRLFGEKGQQQAVELLRLLKHQEMPGAGDLRIFGIREMGQNGFASGDAGVIGIDAERGYV